MSTHPMLLPPWHPSVCSLVLLPFQRTSSFYRPQAIGSLLRRTSSISINIHISQLTLLSCCRPGGTCAVRIITPLLLLLNSPVFGPHFVSVSQGLGSLAPSQGAAHPATSPKHSSPLSGFCDLTYTSPSLTGRLLLLFVSPELLIGPHFVSVSKYEGSLCQSLLRRHDMQIFAV